MNRENYYPLAIFHLTNKEIFISKEEYNYDILILNANDLSKLHHTTKIAIILSDLETNTQIKNVLDLISNLKENKIIPIIFSKSNVPKVIKNSAYIVNSASIDDLKLFLKIIDLLVFKICLVCTDLNDVVNFLKSSTGKMILYKKENISLKDTLKHIEKDLRQEKAQKSIILIEMGYHEAEEVTSGICNKLNLESFLYQVCLNENIKENQINLYLILIN